MNYKEATRLKAEHETTFMEDNIIYKVFVTPENHEDLMKYLTDIRGFYSKLTDRDAKIYSKNGRFSLHGLNYIAKGPNIIYKPVSGSTFL